MEKTKRIRKRIRGVRAFNCVTCSKECSKILDRNKNECLCGNLKDKTSRVCWACFMKRGKKSL